MATELRTCPVKLTEPERLARGHEMAQCEVDIETLKGDRATTGRSIREQEKRRNELGHMLEVGTEPRELACTWVPDYQKNVFNLTRPDTGEVVDTRAMTAADRQGDLLTVEATNLVQLAPPPRSPKGEAATPAKPKRSRKTTTTSPIATA